MPDDIVSLKAMVAQQQKDIERLHRENKKKASAAKLHKLNGQETSEKLIQLQGELALVEQRTKEQGEIIHVILPHTPKEARDEVERNHRERRRKERYMGSPDFDEKRQELCGKFLVPAASSWSVEEVVEWFENLETSSDKVPRRVLEKCRERGLNGATLLELDHEGLKDLGMEDSLRRATVLGFINDLRRRPR